MPVPSPKSILTPPKKYPLAQALVDNLKISPRKFSPSTKFGNRCIDVVSPSLCDDTAQYLAPRLKDYKGCDIIDINPGACLWSQALHKVVQPRRHLLLEPETKYYNAFIKPLVESPDSKYRHSTLFPTHPVRSWDTYDQIFNDELLPKRDKLAPGDPALRKPNRTLLLTGNVHRLYDASKIKPNFSYTAAVSLSNFIQAAQRNSLCHAYGLVKMLLWIPAESRRTVLPWLSIQKVTYAATNELLVDMAEVCGVPHSTKSSRAWEWSIYERRRMDIVDDLIMLDVAQKMQDNDLVMPVHRRPARLQRIEGEAEKIREKASLLHLPLSKDRAKSVKDFEAGLATLELDATSLASKVLTVKEMKEEALSPKAEKLFKSGALAPLQTPMRTRLAEYIEMGIRTFRAEMDLQSLRESVDPVAFSGYLQRLHGVHENLRECLMHKDTMEFKLWHGRAKNIVDDTISALHDPPQLPWDRRPYEPLEAKPDEFWPPIPMMLLEVDPLEDNLSSDITSPEEANKLMRDLLAWLMYRKGSTVFDAMEFIGPDAGKDLIPEAPAVTDPLKGGRFDHRNMRVQQLTREMIRQLLVAYMEWPFRPTDAELRDATSMGMGTEVEDEADIDPDKPSEVI